MLLLRTRDEMEGFNMNGTAGDEVIAAAGVTAEGEDDDALWREDRRLEVICNIRFSCCLLKSDI
jgi:hypothetical protein